MDQVKYRVTWVTADGDKRGPAYVCQVHRDGLLSLLTRCRVRSVEWSGWDEYARVCGECISERTAEVLDWTA